MKRIAFSLVILCSCSMLLGQDKVRVSIDASLHVRQFSTDYLTVTETDEEASHHAGTLFLELEECDDFLLAPRREDSDYVFQLGGLLNWHPDEDSVFEDYNFDFPYETISNSTVWINTWDWTEVKRPAVMEKVEVESPFSLEDVGILSLIEDVVKEACEALTDDLITPQ